MTQSSGLRFPHATAGTDPLATGVGLRGPAVLPGRRTLDQGVSPRSAATTGRKAEGAIEGAIEAPIDGPSDDGRLAGDDVVPSDAPPPEAVTAAGATGAAEGEPPAPEAEDDDDRAAAPILWGLAAGIGAMTLALIGRGGGAPIHPVPPLEAEPLPPVAGTKPDDDGPGVTPPTPTPDPDPDPDPTPDPTPTPDLPPVPVPPSAGRLDLRLLHDTGASAVDRVTADGTARLSVIGADPGTTVRYQQSSDGGLHWADAGDGLINPPEGEWLLRAVVTSADGLESTTASVTLTVDHTSPTPGRLLVRRSADGAGLQFGIEGQEPGADVFYEVSMDGGQHWQPTADQLGALPDGPYQFRARVVDRSGLEGLTPVEAVLVDTQAPTATAFQLRKVGAPGRDVLEPLSASGDVDLWTPPSSDATVRYEQSADGGATWLQVDAAVRGLPAGQYLFRAILADAVGNETVLAEQTLVVNPDAPLLGELDLVGYGGSGDHQQGYRGDVTDLLLQAQTQGAEPVTYQWRSEGDTLWQACAGQLLGLLDGRYEFRAISRSASGAEAVSNVVAVEVDTRDPAAGTVTLTNLLDSGTDTLDRVTADNSFTLTHLGLPAGSSLDWEASTTQGIHWYATTDTQSALADGIYWFRAKVTDAQGQVHYTRTVDVEVDTTAPSRPTLTVLDLDDTGASATDGITQDGSFTLSVARVPAGAQLHYEVSLDGGAHWLPTVAQHTDLASGSYDFRAVASDAAGNASASRAVHITVDREAPGTGSLWLNDFDDTGLAGDWISQDGDFELSTRGTEAGATVQYWHSTDLGLTWALTSALQSGLLDGTHWFRADATDAAGNTSTGPALAVQIDTQAPQAGSLLVTATGGTVDLHWEGTDPVASVRYELTADGGQTWLPLLAHTEALAPGAYAFRAWVEDLAGNAVSTDIVNGVVPEPDTVLDGDARVSVQWGDASDAAWLGSLPPGPHAVL